jgi:gluconolactonase
MAEETKRIECFAPELDHIIELSQPIEELAEGLNEPLGATEGLLWWRKGGYLLFSDIHNNRRVKYEPGNGMSVLLQRTSRANGLTRDRQGRLVACEREARRVTRQELDGSITIIASSLEGRKLNQPNDVVVKSDNYIYFTDPPGVYRVTPISAL